MASMSPTATARVVTEVSRELDNAATCLDCFVFKLQDCKLGLKSCKWLGSEVKQAQ